MPRTINRRQVLRSTALAGASIWLCGRSVGADRKSPNEKLDIAIVGAGGRGRANLGAVAGENIVAICDVDDRRAGNAYKRFRKAKKFHDYRRLFDTMESRIDAVVISTPDHTHFHPAIMAMRMGKHCYCEKPMAHGVAEIRAMTELAAEQKVATQLGVQRHARPSMHRVVELVRSGAIGTVNECYAWVGGDRGMPPMPTEFPAVPSHLKWDLWLGLAADRPYSPAYVPYEWRFWWNFGTGEMGNWGCHVLDVPFWALGLRYPTKVATAGPPVEAQRTPKSMQVRFEFPARGNQPPLTLHWLHTKTGPAILAENKIPHVHSGILFVGSEGMLLYGDFKQCKLYPEKKFAGFEPPAPTIADSPGFHKEWISACKGRPAATCAFDYTGPLAETVILGNVAYRAGHEFEWDAAKMQTPGRDDVQPWLAKTYRKGWEI